MLISKGADIKARTEFSDQTPVHIAAYNNSIQMGKSLISKGADINAEDIIYLNIGILFLINII